MTNASKLHILGEMNLVSLITTAGLKKTKSRQQVLELLLKEGRPMDALEIYTLLVREDTTIDQVTVYRVLDIFFQKGLVHRLEFQEGKFRYELAGEEHHHLICQNCGKIEDISDCGLEAFEKEIRQKKGFIVKKHSLEFFGLCSVCQH